MKNYLLILGLMAVVLVSCKDDEPEIDPLVGTWELDRASVSIPTSTYFGFENDRDLYGETSYVMEFNEDMTYEREIDGIPTSTGAFNFDDEGEWEQDGDEIDLDTEDDEVSFIPYFFEILDLDDDELVITYESSQRIFTDAQIQSWQNDGTLDANLTFTVETQDELDSIYNNFLVDVDAVVTLEFERD